ncbi:hypothetical protein P43SY_008235 [Pythium insidiosum]|uniref:Dihydrolipoamide acetyltransferase component of pyruvate dehydrogenase complex n=1 Tax=Pythium insidiosum TaxID=114742 RepID=A0AAD5LIE0_PYTIN|nr:hypothetical protein P43SY_008235 [Pythium insidiosum]
MSMRSSVSVAARGVRARVARQVRAVSASGAWQARSTQRVMAANANHMAPHARRSSPWSSSSTLSLRAFSTAAPVDVPVPSMGDSISEGTVVEWLKAPGDAVHADDVVVVLETDKVSVDVRAPFAGVLDSQLAAIDDNVLVGAPLFRIIQQDVGAAAAPATPAAAPAATAEPAAQPAAAPAASSSAEELVTVNVPSMGDSITEGTVVTILKNVGDFVRADEPVLIVETDKVSVDVNAPFAGKVTSLMTKLEEVVQVGAPLFVLDKASAPAASAPVAAPVATAQPAAPAAQAPTPAAAAAKPAPVAAAPAAAAAPSTGSQRFSRRETRVQMSVLKTRAAQRLKESQNTAAMLSTFQECDMGNLIALREELGEAFEKTHGVPLGFMSIFLKASALALEKVPAVNSFMDMDAKEIVAHDFADINVAVASEKGIVVPVIRNVEKKSVAEIEQTLLTLSHQAREGSLAIEDLAGGTFSVSNSGVNGGLLSTSMLTSPQSAILGMHGVKMRPAFHNGQVVARPMMFLSLTYDHRIIDGREGVTFLKTIAEAVSDPRRLLLGV